MASAVGRRSSALAIRHMLYATTPYAISENVGWVERSDTHHRRLHTMGIGTQRLNPSYNYGFRSSVHSRELSEQEKRIALSAWRIA